MTIPHPKRATALHSDEEALAIKALTFLAEDRDRLDRFMAASGADPSDLRPAMNEASFRAGVLRFIDEDETLLQAFAKSLGSSSAEVATALARLRHRGEEG